MNGREKVEEFALGSGFIAEKSALKRLSLQGIEANTIQASDAKDTFYPGEMIHQPFGKGTKYYYFYEAFQMMHDMEPYSHYKELRDPLKIITQQPNKGQVIDS